MPSESLLGAIELGGTKIRLAIGTADGRIRTSTAFPTGQPAEAFARIRDWFSPAGISGIGVGAFGPITLQGQGRGCIGRTPKPGWSDWDIAGALAPLGVPVCIDTDVNAAGLAEARLGAVRGHDVALYLTVGTGIGGGLIVAGRPVHGRLHPEMGHIRLLRAPGDTAPSVCPFHADCAEGLASGPAIMARWGQPLSALPADHPAHALIADYLAQLCATVVMIASPGIIILGGGVSATPGLHAAVTAGTHAALGTYLAATAIADTVPPGLGDDAGLIGALLLAA